MGQIAKSHYFQVNKLYEIFSPKINFRESLELTINAFSSHEARKSISNIANII